MKMDGMTGLFIIISLVILYFVLCASWKALTSGPSMEIASKRRAWNYCTTIFVVLCITLVCWLDLMRMQSIIQTGIAALMAVYFIVDGVLLTLTGSCVTHGLKMVFLVSSPDVTKWKFVKQVSYTCHYCLGIVILGPLFLLGLAPFLSDLQSRNLFNKKFQEQLDTFRVNLQQSRLKHQNITDLPEAHINMSFFDELRLKKER